jgi:hypothetical protein
MRLFKRELILLAVVLLTVSIFAKETRDRVVIMDTGINMGKDPLPYLCQDGHIDFSGSGSIQDNNGHGTNIAGLVARGLDTTKQCITVIKYYDTDTDPYNGQKDDIALVNSWNYLLQVNAKWVNMSFVGEIYVPQEYTVIKTLLDRGVKVAVAAGNEKLDLSIKCERFPACYKFNSPNFYVVGAYDVIQSNFNGPVNVLDAGRNQRGHFGPMASGSSQATANVMSKIIKGLIK